MSLVIAMVRETLDGIPEFPLPPGFSLRWHQPGDEKLWLQIHWAADRLQPITPELFAQEFGSDAVALGQRQCYLLAPDGREIGTASAWFKDNLQGKRFGRVHWVAILPEYQGQGIGTSLMTVICRRLIELGHDRAYLTTSIARVPAVRLYRRFGFVPLIRTAEEERAWKSLEASIGEVR